MTVVTIAEPEAPDAFAEVAELVSIQPSHGPKAPSTGRPPASICPVADCRPLQKSTESQGFSPGVAYYGYRWLDPLTGRWPSRDPIGERGGVNLYGFVKNTPSTFFDRLGLQDSFFSRPITPPATLPPEIRRAMMRDAMSLLDRPTQSPFGGRGRPDPYYYQGVLDTSYTINLTRHSQSSGRMCCCMYTSPMAPQRFRDDQFELSGHYRSSYQFQTILFVDKPKDAECDTLPKTISIRIMIISSNNSSYEVIEANGGNTARKTDLYFDLCDSDSEDLSGIEVNVSTNSRDNSDSPSIIQDIGGDLENDDFGPAWQ